jgi:hypothetical protein
MALVLRMRMCPDLALAEKQEKEYLAADVNLMSKYGSFEEMLKMLDSDEEEEKLDKERKALKEKFGIGDGNTHTSVQRIYRDSETEPHHFFKLGYLASTWSKDSFNAVMQAFDIPDLFDIFQIPREHPLPPVVMVDWDAAHQRCQEAFVAFERHMTGPYAKYGVYEVSTGKSDGVGTARAAMETFNREVLKSNVRAEGGKPQRTEDRWEGNGGVFSANPMPVVAVITRNPPTQYPGIMGPGFFVVQECDPNYKHWYYTALEIIKENIDWVRERPNKQDFHFACSTT